MPVERRCTQHAGHRDGADFGEQAVQRRERGNAARVDAEEGDNTTRVVGPAIGGLLVGAVGLGAAVVADSLSFLLSALLIACVAAPRPAAAGEPPVAGRGQASGGRAATIDIL